MILKLKEINKRYKLNKEIQVSFRDKIIEKSLNGVMFLELSTTPIRKRVKRYD